MVFLGYPLFKQALQYVVLACVATSMLKCTGLGGLCSSQLRWLCEAVARMADGLFEVLADFLD